MKKSVRVIWVIISILVAISMVAFLSVPLLY